MGPMDRGSESRLPGMYEWYVGVVCRRRDKRRANILNGMERINENVYTSWSKVNDPNFVSHERRLRYLLECHKFGIILTVMNGGIG